MLNLAKYSAVSNNIGRNLESTSERYSFIPTQRVLSVLEQHGWFPSLVKQSRTNKQSNDGYQKHIVHLRNNEEFPAIDSTFPEILVMNSHGGTSAFCLLAGLFELVCSNGLIVSREKYGNHRVLHKGYTDDKVSAAIKQTVLNLTKVLTVRDRMIARTMDRQEQLAFAKAAFLLRFEEDKHVVGLNQILNVRHHQQSAPNLWNTFNVIQESIVSGGINQRNLQTNKVRKVRGLTNIQENVRINESLWELAENWL